MQNNIEKRWRKKETDNLKQFIKHVIDKFEDEVVKFQKDVTRTQEIVQENTYKQISGLNAGSGMKLVQGTQ